MLRVGLTGGLGSGKSTAARMFAERGAVVFSSDAIGRELMQPGQAVYRQVVARFGRGVVQPDGELDRAALARLVFQPEGGGPLLEELNGMVHPAVAARQEELLRALAPDAIAVVESALIFDRGEAAWRARFDCFVLVTAPEPVKVARFLERSGATAETAETLAAEARRRLAVQMPDSAKAPLCDYVLANDSDEAALETQVGRVWGELVLRSGL
jgi:dephospho-CoA kinase